MPSNTLRYYHETLTVIKKVLAVNIELLITPVSVNSTFTIASTVVNNTIFSNTISVPLSSNAVDAIIIYTIDGSTPFLSSTIYTGAVLIGQTTLLKARAYLPGVNQYSSLLSLQLNKQP